MKEWSYPALARMWEKRTLPCRRGPWAEAPLFWRAVWGSLLGAHHAPILKTGIPIFALSPTDVLAQEANDGCQRIFNAILFVRVKHLRQDQWLSGSSGLGQLYKGQHETGRRGCAHACTHTPWGMCHYRWLLWGWACGKGPTLTFPLCISRLWHYFHHLKTSTYALKREEINTPKSRPWVMFAGTVFSPLTQVYLPSPA